MTTYTNDRDMLGIFSPICARLVMTGEHGDERIEITSDPFSWFNRVRSMWGDAKRNLMPSSILAEMFALHMAYEKGLEPKWEGPNGALVDIRGNTQDIEVKSTVSQDKTEITISRELQLKKADNDLHLYFVSLQQSEAG